MTGSRNAGPWPEGRQPSDIEASLCQGVFFWVGIDAALIASGLKCAEVGAGRRVIGGPGCDLSQEPVKGWKPVTRTSVLSRLSTLGRLAPPLVGEQPAVDDGGRLALYGDQTVPQIAVIDLPA
jgi:hypothetical protein